ncbi:Stomatin-like protein 2, mitochondrial [Araneus ventricosus]|uniref:Stomatin-like protein 2, mitochondrial n=1 Tax=Araneus ventricosus TaxID=182803 RepID=A0A4Y2M919_ARAVE|nr:Stomatin-like protein 2, mitochondrial [Araneus ventricosus]
MPRQTSRNLGSLTQTQRILQLNFPQHDFVRHAQSTPFNTIIMFVPQQEAWIVERMGKFNRILQPGLNFLIPIVDRIKYVQSLKELAIDIPKQSAITLDRCFRQFETGLFKSLIAAAYCDLTSTVEPQLSKTLLTGTLFNRRQFP